MQSLVSAESPTGQEHLEIPVHCNNLSEVFSKSKANACPPHHLYDRYTEVVDGSIPSRYTPDLLFSVEWKAMKGYTWFTLSLQ